MTERSPPGIFGLVVMDAASAPRRTGRVLRTRVDDSRPPDAIRHNDSEDPRELALTVVGVFESARGERPRQAYLVSSNRYLHTPDARIEGASARLPLALAVIADLYGLVPPHNVYATGSVTKADGGAVNCVAEVACKLRAVADDIERHHLEHALVLIPKMLRVEGEDSAEQRDVVTEIARLEALNAAVKPVDHLAEAAALAFGAAFAAVSVKIGAARKELHKLLYDYKYEDAVLQADRMYTLASELPTEALVRRALVAEALAIGAWAASRMRADQSFGFRGDQQTFGAVHQTLTAERDALLVQHAQAIWPETRALVENLRAISHIGASLDFARGEQIANEALAIPGVVEGPQGEHRKLLGTRAQLRWRRGLRERHADNDYEAEWLLDLAVEDATRAHELALQPDVDVANDRARVEVYLANALLCRGKDDDRRRARALLRDLLGVDEAGVIVAKPRQEPGWALRLFAWELRHDGAGLLLQRWRHWAGQLGCERGTLADRMRATEFVPYREPLAATLAADALAAGDTASAVALLDHANQHPNLRSLAWWWPMLRDERTVEHQKLAGYRVARTDQFRSGVSRGDGPGRGKPVDRLLLQLASSDPGVADDAWRRLTLWIGEPDPIREPAR